MAIDFPEQFWKEENRCGYVISKEVKKIWAVQLDLLSQFAQVCEQHNLRYFLNGGTLLGAVRHKGFIPWDDDVDVMMPRQDYDRLCQIASQVFQHPYFFQTALTEHGLFRCHAQLRNSNTTGYITADASKDINKGIFLDIFILDNLPDSPLALRLHKKQLDICKRIFLYAYDWQYEDLSEFKKILYRLYHWTFRIVSFHDQYRIFDQKVLAKYANKSTHMVGDLTLNWNERTHWNADWFSDYCYLPFETLYLRAPAEYKQILSKQYGDFMKFPEESQRKINRHGSVFLDPETPYTAYFPNKKL